MLNLFQKIVAELSFDNLMFLLGGFIVSVGFALLFQSVGVLVVSLGGTILGVVFGRVIT